MASGHLHCWVWCLSSRFSGVQVRRVCWSIKHSNTMVIKPAFGTFGTVDRCQVLLENEISISISWSAEVSMKCSKCPGRCCVDWGLQKTQWTNTSRWHGTPNHHWLWKTSHWTSRTWILCLSSIPQQSSCFSLIPGKMLLTMFLFQKWLGSTFPEDVWAWWLLIHWLQLLFTPREALSSVWISFAWQYSQACSHPCCLCTFPNPIPSFQSTLHLICFDTALLEQPPPPPFSNDPLWLTLFVGGVNDRLLEHCQVSSVLHYCAFKEKEIYTVWMVINLNSM